MDSPLLVTRDLELSETVAALAAGAGLTPITVEPSTALTVWRAAPLVLVGVDAMQEVARARPERRDRVIALRARPGEVDAADWTAALRVGATDWLRLPDQAADLARRLGEVSETTVREGLLLGVMGGSGGAGATTLASALAQVAAVAREVALVDCDPLGPGLDRMFALEATDGSRWNDLDRPSGRINADALHRAIPRLGNLGVLTWAADAPPLDSGDPLPIEAAREVLAAARRGHDLVVIDLPRVPSPWVDELLGRCDVVVVVVRAEYSSIAAASRATRRRLRGGAGVAVVRGGPRGAVVDPDSVAEALAVPVVATMRSERRVVEAVDLGLGPVPGRRGSLQRACRRILRETA